MAQLNASAVVSKWAGLTDLQYQAADFGTRSQSCYARGPVLYNYGPHFPLVRYLETVGGRKLYLKNGDTYRGSGGFGRSTSGLQAQVERLCRGPTIPESVLANLGLVFETLPRAAIVAYRATARVWSLVYDLKAKTYQKHEQKSPGDIPELIVWAPPRQGMFVPHARQDEPGVIQGAWHILGAVLLDHDGASYLCALDESRYFVSQLARPARSIDVAFRQLKPRIVRDAEQRGETVPRQGEWFFVSLGFDDAAMADAFLLTPAEFKKRIQRDAPIPETRAKDNRHHATLFISGDIVYARGRVMHKSVPLRQGARATMTREHRTIDLGEIWHRAIHNTEVRSWGASGRFD